MFELDYIYIYSIFILDQFKVALVKWMIRIENNQREIKAVVETLKLGCDKVPSSRNTILIKLGLPASSVETLLNVNTILEDKENFKDLVSKLHTHNCCKNIYIFKEINVYIITKIVKYIFMCIFL